MDELGRVRIELEQLRKRECDLHEELSRVRATIEAHKSRIEHLAWVKAPINLLSTETLSNVLELVARTQNSFELQTLTLARVSRAWRDVILNSAKFWSRIDLSHSPKFELVPREGTCGKVYPESTGYLHLRLGEGRFSTFYFYRCHCTSCPPLAYP